MIIFFYFEIILNKFLDFLKIHQIFYDNDDYLSIFSEFDLFDIKFESG